MNHLQALGASLARPLHPFGDVVLRRLPRHALFARFPFHPLLDLLRAGRHHAVQPVGRALYDRAEPALVNLARKVGVAPARMVRGHVDARVLPVPGRQLRVNVRLDGAEGAVDEVNHTAHPIFAVCESRVSNRLPFPSNVMDTLAHTSIDQQHLYSQISVPDSHQEDFVGIVRLEIVVP